MLEVADDDALGEVEQDRFQPTLLFLRAPRGCRDRLRCFGARDGELLRKLFDGTRKPLKCMPLRHQQRTVLLREGQSFGFACQCLDRPNEQNVKDSPGDGEQ